MNEKEATEDILEISIYRVGNDYKTSLTAKGSQVAMYGMMKKAHIMMNEIQSEMYKANHEEEALR